MIHHDTADMMLCHRASLYKFLLSASHSQCCCVCLFLPPLPTQLTFSRNKKCVNVRKTESCMICTPYATYGSLAFHHIARHPVVCE